MLTEILDFLRKKGVDVISSTEREIITKHDIQGTIVEIKGIYKSLEENRLPRYYVCNRDKYGLIAHIGWDNKENIGLCCSGSDDVLSLNYQEPEKVYYEGLLRALKLLQPTLNNPAENKKQIIEEYLGHLGWVKNEEHPSVMFIGEHLPGINLLTAYKPKSNGIQTKEIIITHESNGINKDYCLLHNLFKRDSYAVSVLLELNELILPPTPKDDIKDWWIELLNNQGEDFQINLTQQIRSIRNTHFYFICYANYNDEKLTFCISCKNDRKKDFAPINDATLAQWDIKIVNLIQHTKEYLLPRSGGSLIFQDKKVLLVGCGSVGSFIAKQMVQSGIGTLTLSDNDLFQVENLYRHNLSLLYKGTPKSKAIALHLGYEYPYTNILPRIDELSKIPKEILLEQDLIIIAIGNPTQERVFNAYLKKEAIEIDVIYTWLEGYGVGGHAIFVNGTMATGCLECNYIDLNTEELILHSNINFLYPNQNVTKDLGGCGSLFLPYSHLDAEQTALLASRMAIDVLSGKIKDSVRISWKGASDDAQLQDLQFTHRYSRYTTSKYEGYKQEYCIVCN